MAEVPTAVKSLSAFIIGSTGEVGKELLKALVANPSFSRIVTIGRRKVEYPSEGYEKVEQREVDFEKLSEYAEDFRGFDVGFCTLGTTRGKAGKEGFIRVDHDYVLESAKLAKEGDCKHFSLVTSMGSNKNSMFLYTKTKGQVEEAIKELNFTRFSVFRPATLLCDRTESRFGERVARGILGTLDFGRKLSVTTADVAKCMVMSALKESGESFEIFENSNINTMAKTQ